MPDQDFESPLVPGPTQESYLDLVHDAALSFDLEKPVIRYWNRGAEDMYGYTRAEALGQNPHELLKTQFPRPLAEIEQHLREYGRWEGELVQTRRDGTWRIVRARWALRREAGKPVGVLEVNHDITDERQGLKALLDSEQALRERENVLRAIIDNTDDPIFIKDREGRVVLANPAFARLTGRERPEDVLGTGTDEHVPDPEIGRQVRADDARVLATEMPMVVEYTTPTRPEAGVLQTRLFPFRDPSGEVTGIVGMMRDITALRRAEETLQQHNEELQALNAELEAQSEELEAQHHALERQKALTESIIAHAPAALAYLDRDLVYRWNNPAHSRQIGMPREAIVGKSIFEALPRVAPVTEPLYRQVLESGRAMSFHGIRVPLRRGNEEVISYWDVTYVPVFDEGPEAVGILVSGIEVTDRMEVERLQRAQLEQLTAIDQQKDQFLSILSHELRTPLNAILGFASVLDDEVVGALTAEQHRYLGKILGGTEVLLALINDLLDMSRIQAGRFSIEPRRIGFSGVVARVTEHLAVMAEQKGQRLENAVPRDLPLLWADEQRLEQVLVNLVGNAIKFTPEGGTIRVRAEIADNALVCEVEDNGVGIAPEDQAKLFHPFTQVDASNTRQAGGTGLGLSISKALVEAHGGSIGIRRCVPGEGCVFYFTLPLAAGHPA